MLLQKYVAAADLLLQILDGFVVLRLERRPGRHQLVVKLLEFDATGAAVRVLALEGRKRPPQIEVLGHDRSLRL